MLDRAKTWAIRNVIFRAHEVLKRHHTLRILQDMEADQYRPIDELLRLQQARLRIHLARAAADVPYYRDLFPNIGCRPEDIKSVCDLKHLPFLTKEIIREQGSRLCSSRARRGTMFSTGGSTGAPLTFFLGNTRASSDVASRCRAEAWFGVGIGDPEFVIWGASVELSKQDRLRLLRDRVMRTRLLSAFEMSEATMDEYLRIITAQGCHRVFGYPSSIALLAAHAQRRGVDLSRLGTRAVFVTGEYLWDEWRKIIEDSFRCPVGNGYGGRDSGFIAHECLAGSLHVSADRMVIELVSESGDPVPPGVLGEIVVTHLDSPELPLIRYRTGDMALYSSEACSCGVTLPIFERVVGRKTDFIIAPDGRVMHGLSLIYVLREVPGVKQFRILQRESDKFEVEIVREMQQFPASAEEIIREKFRARLKAPVQVAFRYFDHIQSSASGKFRFVISDVPMPAGMGSVAISAKDGGS